MCDLVAATHTEDGVSNDERCPQCLFTRRIFLVTHHREVSVDAALNEIRSPAGSVKYKQKLSYHRRPTPRSSSRPQCCKQRTDVHVHQPATAQLRWQHGDSRRAVAKQHSSWETTATRWFTPTVLYADVGGRCDKLVTEDRHQFMMRNWRKHTWPST